MKVSIHLDNKARTLGFETYDDYLKNSTKWHIFRMGRIAKRCFACGEWRPYRLNLHHVAYDRLGDELDSDVVTLCEWCHEKCHQMIYDRQARLIDAHHLLREEIRVRGLNQPDLPLTGSSDIGAIHSNPL